MASNVNSGQIVITNAQYAAIQRSLAKMQATLAFPMYGNSIYQTIGKHVYLNGEVHEVPDDSPNEIFFPPDHVPTWVVVCSSAYFLIFWSCIIWPASILNIANIFWNDPIVSAYTLIITMVCFVAVVFCVIMQLYCYKIYRYYYHKKTVFD